MTLGAMAGDRRMSGATASTRAVAPSFFQAFPKKCGFMPSFSKECVGGFVGFQGVTIDPNP
jgi:hypothetical protein